MIQHETSLPFYIFFFFILYIRRMILKRYHYQKRKKKEKMHCTRNILLLQTSYFLPITVLLFQSAKFIFRLIFLQIIHIFIPRTDKYVRSPPFSPLLPPIFPCEAFKKKKKERGARLHRRRIQINFSPWASCLPLSD